LQVVAGGAKDALSQVYTRERPSVIKCRWYWKLSLSDVTHRWNEDFFHYGNICHARSSRCF